MKNIFSMLQHALNSAIMFFKYGSLTNFEDV